MEAFHSRQKRKLFLDKKRKMTMQNGCGVSSDAVLREITNTNPSPNITYGNSYDHNISSKSKALCSEARLKRKQCLQDKKTGFVHNNETVTEDQVHVDFVSASIQCNQSRRRRKIELQSDKANYSHTVVDNDNSSCVTNTSSERERPKRRSLFDNYIRSGDDPVARPAMSEADITPWVSVTVPSHLFTPPSESAMISIQTMEVPQDTNFDNTTSSTTPASTVVSPKKVGTKRKRPNNVRTNMKDKFKIYQLNLEERFNAVDTEPSQSENIGGCINILHDMAIQVYEDFGDPVCKCSFCGANFWRSERVTSYGSTLANPIYTLCCMRGKVQIPFLKDPPPYLHELVFEGNSEASSNFIDNIRMYNSSFAFTSMGGKIDRSVNNGGGRYTFRLSGQNHHKIGSLLPVKGEKAKFAQHYIYDTQNEVENRLNFVSGSSSVLMPEIVEKLKEMLDLFNPFSQSFRMARDCYVSGLLDNIYLRLVRARAEDGRTYNTPTASEVAVLIVGDLDVSNFNRDIILQKQCGGLKRIDELHPSYLALQYPLLFPYGEDGFRENILHHQSYLDDNDKESKLTMRQFFSFRIHEREFEVSVLLYARRLFQQFVVDAYTMIESNRLKFIKYNQKKLRADLYKGVVDAVSRGVSSGSFTGKRIVLPSSFTGGPRYMMQHYQDSMAICRWTGYPHIFITFTCNPKWPEIERFVTQRGLKAEDRPDIIARVFKLKLVNLLKDLKSGKFFGKVNAVVYTVEFQKRGLPHCHILLFLRGVDVNYPEEKIDSFISAEIPHKHRNAKLYEAVQEYMVHGPCGAFNSKSPCMSSKTCTKFFPKQFNASTYINDEGFPVYRRREDGRVIDKGKSQLDNQWIVPYNPFLLLKYQSHINVEWCNQSSAVKYLFKYINKGSDRVTAVLNSDSECNEIKTYLDCRYVSACEASWRIFGNEIHHRTPAVVRLPMHLEDEQCLIYEDGDNLEQVVCDEGSTKSMFVAWMEANVKYPQLASDLLYIQFPIYFTYYRDAREWCPRKSGMCVGRLCNISYNAGELYYLSMLVMKVKGPKCYKDIRTVDGVVYNTFKEACSVRGLLQNDNEFIEAINEAATWGSGSYLRQLFVTMLLSNSVSMPLEIWNNTWHHLCDDIVYTQRRILQRLDVTFSEAEIKNLGLCEIQRILEGNGKSLADFPDMPAIDHSLRGPTFNRLIAEQLNYDKAALAEEFRLLEGKMTDEQQNVFQQIVSATLSGSGGFFFVYGYGGTGKTFLWTVLTSFLRSKGFIVLAVASSGIASTLLPGGRTAHSRFCIPIEINDESTCNIPQGSLVAELLLEAKLIIWDEAPMVKKQCFEAFDRSLRDIMQSKNPNSENLPFGGKCVVLGGDFRQILPVIRNGSRADIVFASINASYLWRYCTVMKLTKNMRLQLETNGGGAEELKRFSEWILELGDGKLGQPNDGQIEIDIPPEFLIQEFEHPIEALVQNIYPHILANFDNADYLRDRAILAPRVDVVHEVNDYIQSMIPGEEKIYLSADGLLNDGGENTFEQQHSVDFLNSITCSGLPAHKLKLKVGVPIMLLRNVDQAAGLCNGTRLIVTRLGTHVIAAKVISGGPFGQTIFLPRMNTSLSDSTMPFRFERRQFPVSISYCMTINKSQGQSLSKVGIYLPKPVFSHGQLYVAVSRVKFKSGLKLLIHDKDLKPLTETQNVVYLEVYDNVN